MVVKKDKRGVIGIIIFFLILFTILIVGFAAVMLTGVLGFASDTITPVMEGIGMVGDANVSQAATYSFGVMDNFMKAVPWLITLGYVLMLIFSIVFVVSYNTNPHPAFIGLYFAFVILLIFGAIIISNAYQDIYEGTDEIALKLQENSAMSYLILYSPMIFAIISFFAGIYLFAGNRSEGGSSI